MQAKFKFKFVLTTVNYRAFCLFRFGKTVFNFKFKLILRKKKIYVNNFLTNFQLRLFISSAKISSLLGNYVTIRRTRHTGRGEDEIRYPVDYRFFPGFLISTFG